MKCGRVTFGLIIAIIGCGFLANMFFPVLETNLTKIAHKIIPLPTQSSGIVEVGINLSEIEKSTMSGSFIQEYKDIAATRSGDNGTVAGTSIIVSPTITSITPSPIPQFTPLSN